MSQPSGILLVRRPQLNPAQGGTMVTKISFLRDQICALLHDSPTCVEEDLEALSQCEAQVRNRCIVANIARECGLALAGFLTNDALELYYDIKRGRHDLGYISKGWEDPGFRIGDLVEIDQWEADILKANTPYIIRFCATNGIAMTVQETPTTITIQLDGVIYSEGFNRDTFLKTLETLNDCVEKIHTLIPGGRHDRHPLAGYLCRELASPSSRSH
jgi:hypothetical protein